jgi:hypothetical protein
MKRIIYISFILVGLAAVSCSKEQIHPTVDSAGDVPIWKSSKSSSDDVTSPTDGGGSITDPNNDKDENPRRKN